MTHALPPLTNQLLDAFIASAWLCLLWAARVIAQFTAPRRSRRLDRLVAYLERGVESILFLRAVHRFGPMPHRTRIPRAAPPGFRRQRHARLSLFFRNSGVRARKANVSPASRPHLPIPSRTSLISSSASCAACAGRASSPSRRRPQRLASTRRTPRSASTAPERAPHPAIWLRTVLADPRAQASAQALRFPRPWEGAGAGGEVRCCGSIACTCRFSRNAALYVGGGRLFLADP